MECEVALAAARQAGAVQLAARLTDGSIERKADRSPVTAIDKQCEALIRDALQTAFPDDGFLGEESGAITGKGKRRWIVDPLDGTRPFIRGIPTYSCLIALEEDGAPVVGVIHLPALGESYWAAKGAGAFRNGSPIRVSSIRDPAEATGSAFGYVQRRGEPIAGTLLELAATWDYAYGFMDNYTYGAIAAGKIDLCVNLLDRAWDCAAAACLVSEAGGAYSDIHGNRTVHNGSIVLTNGWLHDATLAALAHGAIQPTADARPQKPAADQQSLYPLPSL
jgi:histidinol phosphatase-like enzyme (inositol monophosphatase family)